MSLQGLLSQYCAIVPLIVDAGDITSSLSSDSIDMSQWDHCCMLYIHSASVTGHSVFKVRAAATDAGTTMDITFTYRYGGAAVASSNADVLTAPATSAALTLTDSTYQGRVFVVEFDTADMQSSGVQYRYATANFDGTASGGTVCGVAVLTRGRFMKDILATVVG